MKIDDVTLTIFGWEGIPSARYHGTTSTLPTSDLGLLTIRTDAGLAGHAFLGSSRNPASMDGPMLIRWLKPLLMGADPFDRERLHAEMLRLSRVATYRTVGAVDVALWDIAGKAASLPIYALLGGANPSVPAYISSAILSGTDAYVEDALSVQGGGAVGYKIHPPQTPALDIQICAAVREAVGSEYTLMLDSTWSYDYPDALRVGRAIQELDYYWYEDPLSESDVYNYVKLREKLDIPILATEYPTGDLTTYPIWLTERATDFLRGDVPNKGGITTMVKTAHLAEAFGMSYEVHHGGNSLNNIAHAHVTAALPNTHFFEIILPAEAQQYGLSEELSVNKDGCITAPSGPGLGAEIDFDLIKRRELAVLS